MLAALISVAAVLSLVSVTLGLFSTLTGKDPLPKRIRSLLRRVPASAEDLAEVKPEYRALPGWQSDTYGVQDAGKLPRAAVDYLKFISDFLNVEIGMISTGPERDATIVCSGTKLASWV